MRPKLKFINFQEFFQWKIWGRSWPGGFRAYKNFKNPLNNAWMDAMSYFHPDTCPKCVNPKKI
jgi:hypothetical protein